MTCVLTIAILKSVLIAQLSTAGVKPTNVVAVHSGTMPSDTSASIAALPPLPSGRSTVIGGAIRSVDPVRDQLTLKVFDSHSMKILFDARTQAFRDGKRIPLRDLEPVEHASIQTMLDGTSVFAVSIHILSQVPHGEMHGQVLSYDASSEELSLRETLSKEPIKVRVPAGTVVTNIGQAASGSDSVASLAKGTLVSIDFQAGIDGHGVARHVAVLAAPGSAFVFNGNITFFDIHAGRLAIVDPRDAKNYSISFDPARFPVSRNFTEGTHVKVTTTFDGERYVASEISVE